MSSARVATPLYNAGATVLPVCLEICEHPLLDEIICLDIKDYLSTPFDERC